MLLFDGLCKSNGDGDFKINGAQLSEMEIEWFMTVLLSIARVYLWEKKDVPFCVCLQKLYMYYN